jgi:hypothetical protein
MVSAIKMSAMIPNSRYAISIVFVFYLFVVIRTRLGVVSKARKLVIGL